MPARVPRLSVGFVRSKGRLRLGAGSAALRKVLVTVRSLSDADTLPGPADFETTFAPGRAYVRRVAGQNLWVLYRFDETYVDILALRDDPPVPLDSAE